MRAFHLRAAAAVAGVALSIGSPASAFATTYQRSFQNVSAPGVVFSKTLSKDVRLSVYGNGAIVRRDGKSIQTQYATPLLARELREPDLAPYAENRVIAMLRHPNRLRPYLPQRILVVFSPNVGVPDDALTVAPKSGKAHYTSDARINAVLADLGVDRMSRVLRKYPRGELSMLHSRAMAHPQTAPALDISSLYLLHLTNSRVERAVRALAKLPGVEYAEPDWRVSTTLGPAYPIPKQAVDTMAARRLQMRMRPHFRLMGTDAAGSGLPENFGVQSSLEGQMSAPGVDAIAAYDEVERKFGQLPGTGVRITNVSIGLITGTEEKFDNQDDPCIDYYDYYGPTTRLIGGQRYLDWPGMPLIPVYVSQASGEISGTALSCDPSDDPTLGEVGLDFSMMAPLPADMQRPTASASGSMELLGIAPGAKYRLVVPASLQDAGTSDIIAALLTAAMQTPAPDIITASLGFGTDGEGFPSRYLEDDVIAASTVATIVNGLDVVVCISSGDGLRTFTNAAVNPSGGSTPTELAASVAQRTNFEDLALSTAPSYDVDSGAIDVGGTTLDDITAYNPLDSSSGAYANVGTYPETRWTGFAGLSSGFGKRVNLSAPSDNVVAMYHCWAPEPGYPGLPECGIGSGAYNATAEEITGGTSASAPEAAAAAAVAIQVARLTGHPFTSAVAVRDFLASTARPVAQAPQTDTPLEVGPQLDARNAVEALLRRANASLPHGVARVDVMQRQSGVFSLDFGTPDTLYLTGTDPSDISLDGPHLALSGQPTNMDAYSPITIAPAWENVPARARYRLFVAGNPSRVLSRKPYARLYPADILAAAGYGLTGTGTRSVKLTYQAYLGLAGLAQSTFTLQFGALAQSSGYFAAAPVAPPVASGATIPVSYDISRVSTAVLNAPALVVSYPGRPNPGSNANFIPLWSRPLASLKGTIDVPVGALAGGGIYGIGILLNRAGPAGFPYYSDFSYTRVAGSATVARPAAPLLGMPGTTSFGHFLEIPYKGSFEVHYDVRDVPGATGAILEIAAPGPDFYYNAMTFNNPNGTGFDDDGKDSPSVARIPLAGTWGAITLSAAQARLRPTLENGVRIVATNGTRTVGEDGEVSTIAEDGIGPANGGNLFYGFGINTNGTDGLFVSAVPTYGGPLPPLLSELATFSQTTGAVTAWNNQFTYPPSYFQMPGFGLFPAGDTAFYMWRPFAQGGTSQFRQIPNLANTVYPFGQTVDVPPPPDQYSFYSSGTNHDDAVAAMALVDPASATGRFNSFAVDLSQPPAMPALLTLPSSNYVYPAMHDATFQAFDYDSSAKTGYMVIDDAGYGVSCNSASPLIAAFNYASSTVSSLRVGGTYYGTGDFVVDPSTHVAAISTICPGIFTGIMLIDLTRGSVVGTAPVEGVAGYPGMLAIDPVNHLVLAQLPEPDDWNYNEDAMSQIYVLDERGNLREKITGIDASFTILQEHFFTANGKTRTAFMYGPFTGYVDSLDNAVFSNITPVSY